MAESQWVHSLDSWSNNLSTNASDCSVNGNSNQYDFAPTYYQSEVVSAVVNTGKVVFLPKEQDKLLVTLLLVKRIDSELRRKKKCIFYIVDSIERGRGIASVLRRHTDLDVTFLTSPPDYDLPSAQILVYFHDSLESASAQNMIQNVLRNLLFLIVDDCVYSMTEHPVKEVLRLFLRASEHEDVRIIGLTSTLIHNDLEIDRMYEYFVQMERTLKSAIVTPHNCNAVNKYLTPIKFKRVKYTFPEKWTLRSDAISINNLIKYLYTMINILTYSDSERESVQDRLKTIFDDFMKIVNSHGLYPSFVAAVLSRIALEKLKLVCSNDSLFVAVSAIITDFNVISKWLEKTIPLSGCDASVIKDSCDVKITKTWSLISKINSEKNCIIFVQDTITAQMLSHVLHQLISLEKKEFLKVGHIMINGSNEDFQTEREKLYQEKMARRVLKGFREGLLNILVLPWKNSRITTELNADWIFYFDLPPDYISFVSSQKYGNVTQNEYYFFVKEDDTDTNLKIQPFVDISVVLREVLFKKNLLNEDEMRKNFRATQMTEEKLNDMFSTLISKEVDLFKGIGIVNRYCESLPTDAFTRVAPFWTIEKNDSNVTCRLQLPLEPSIRCVVETEPIKDIAITKQIAALKAIQILRESHQLDAEMLPQIHQIDSDPSYNNLFPLWRHERDDLEPGTSHCSRIVPITFPEWLYDSAPKSGVDCYVHVIHLNPADKEPSETESRKRYFHELIKSREEFGIVTRKQLPDVCQFPVFNDLGQVDVSIKVNALVTNFTEQQVDKLFSFHRFVFLDVLKVVKRFLVADSSQKENSFLVAPLRIDDDGLVQLAWDVIDNAYIKDIEVPSDQERILTDYVSKDYVGKVITPWYRVLPLRNYVVTRMAKDISPSCQFASDDYQTFASYYSDKYGIEVKQPIQPLLEARAIPINLNCLRPRARTPGIRRKMGEKELDFDEILIPELCVQQPFPAVYWYKSITLVAITHRLHYILLAEMIRQRVAAHEPKKSWPSDENDVIEVDNDCISVYEESSKKVVPVASILLDVKWTKTARRYPWAGERLPIDVDRNFNTTNILEVMLQHDFTRKPDCVDDPNPNIEYSRCEEVLGTIECYPKCLRLERELSPGPKQSDIYQALTSGVCGDVVDCKSLKIIGRSFLKFAGSLLLYRLYPNLNVLQLKRLRGKLIGKRNLFYCGSNLQLASCLKLHDINLDYDWNFGGFSIPKEILNAIRESGLQPEVIFNLEIPESEQSTGVLSADTRHEAHERMSNYFNETSREETNFLSQESSLSNDNNNHVLIYFKKQSVPDKTVVDALKALTGVYLVNCGIDGAMKFLQFMQIIPSDITSQELFVANSNTPDPQELYHQVFVARKFESKPLFVQAFTHHSCYPVHSSECNQKLAFLGGAILDFLLTTCIFEHRNRDLTYSELEDARVALVSDVLFAAILVRFGLHKHLLVQSPSLVEKINEYITQQKRVKHEVKEHDYLFLVEETSHQILEKVDVPKILSDTFKALIAAIFLETADLKNVWRICYYFMQSEIDTFMHNPPVNPVKILDETDLVVEYEKHKSHEYDPTLRVVEMRVEIDKNNLQFTGVGEDKQQAKLIAAKLALKNMSKHYTL